MSCEHESQVQAYHDGELSPADRAAVQGHLATCADCAALLDELRMVSRMLAAAPLPEMRDAAVGRFYGAWNRAAVSGERAVRRITGWMTAAAAAVLVFGLLRITMAQSGAIASAANPPHVDPWELDAVASVAPADQARDDAAGGTGSVELVQVAQWMAQDLSRGR